jgi:hypothetical protein
VDIDDLLILLLELAVIEPSFVSSLCRGDPSGDDGDDDVSSKSRVSISKIVAFASLQRRGENIREIVGKGKKSAVVMPFRIDSAITSLENTLLPCRTAPVSTGPSLRGNTTSGLIDNAFAATCAEYEAAAAAVVAPAASAASGKSRPEAASNMRAVISNGVV